MSRFFNFNQPEPLKTAQSQHMSLQQLLREVQRRVEGDGHTYWVVAEIAGVNYAPSGHIYFECVQPHGDGMLAKCRAACWRATAERIVPAFERATRTRLRAGLELLMRVGVSFHTVYGFSLHVHEIDINFTLGALARQRQAIIQRLQDEGLLDRNAQQDMPLVPQRLAVISSKTAAGFEDFCKEITALVADKKYGVEIHLYPALMQGDGAEKSIVRALSQVQRVAFDYDVVLIMRGGGASTDLSCFDSYVLARAVAHFPLPVVTGIGHERDTSVLDLAAHTSLKTPTAVAHFIGDALQSFVQRMHDAWDVLCAQSAEAVEGSKRQLAEHALLLHTRVGAQLQSQRHHLHVSSIYVEKSARRILTAQYNRVSDMGKRIPRLFCKGIDAARTALHSATQKLFKTAPKKITDQYHRLHMYESVVRASDPKRLLHRGYSITYRQGTLVRTLDALQRGDTITTLFQGGSVTSTVEDIQTKEIP